MSFEPPSVLSLDDDTLEYRNPFAQLPKNHNLEKFLDYDADIDENEILFDIKREFVFQNYDEHVLIFEIDL